MRRQVSTAHGHWPATGSVPADRYRSVTAVRAGGGRPVGRRVLGGWDLHTNAAGDFLLLAASDWRELAGLPVRALECVCVRRMMAERKAGVCLCVCARSRARSRSIHA